MSIQNATGNNSKLGDNVHSAVLGQTHLKKTLTAAIHEYVNAQLATHTKLTIENGGKTPLRVTRPKQPIRNTVSVLCCCLVELLSDTIL